MLLGIQKCGKLEMFTTGRAKEANECNVMAAQEKQLELDQLNTTSMRNNLFPWSEVWRRKLL